MFRPLDHNEWYPQNDGQEPIWNTQEDTQENAENQAVPVAEAEQFTQYPTETYTPVYPAYSAYPYANTQVFPPPVKTKPVKKKKSRMRFAAALAAVCMLSSGVFGFGGVYLANYLQGNDANSSAGNNAAVMYQSVSSKTTATSTNSGKSVAEVAAAVKESVVEITTEVVSRNGRMGQLISTGAGSGVILTEDGYIVTNNHVIDGASSITIRLADGTECDATVVGTDAKTDLAVLKINATGLTPAVLGDSGALAVGETAVAIGNPLGELGGTVTEGIISALDREITIDGESMSLLQTSAAINPGNSGGGLFNLNGELVGIVNAKSSGSDIEGLGFAIPINTAKSVIEDLIENGYVTGRVDTGLTLVDVQDATTAMYYRVSRLGLYISKSTNSSLQSGDLIQEVNGESVENLADYNKLLDGCKVGDSITITVLRSGRTVTETVVLGELRT